MRYDGFQPGVARPPAHVVDAPLPTIYCEKVNQWVFVYETPGSIQFYRLDPRRRESYHTLFTNVVEGKVSPWAMKASGRETYLVNVDPAADAVFDYSVAAPRFDLCAELEASPAVTAVSGEEMEECRAAYRRE